mmetsp:Transcript_18369/g.42538  ORF Transcript_18369/g.42538 Transcript_18369/m.42538 type:complete len:187 (-) Transcript_18369:41-601(-)
MSLLVQTEASSTASSTPPLSSEEQIAVPQEDHYKSISSEDVVKLSSATSDCNILKGRSVSGRSWKVRPQKRASFLRKTKMNNLHSTSWEARQEAKRLRQAVLEQQRELQQERISAKQRKRERRLENQKRRAENEFKQAQRAAQTLNPTKVGITLKAMSKKQLRQIKKSRVDPKTGVTEYVPAYFKG